MRRSRSLATGAARRSRECANSYTRQTLRLSKSGSGWATPVWSHGGIVCTGETYKNVVKMTFAKGAALKDPSRLFNSSLDGNVRRAIDIHEGDKVDEAALKDLIRAAVALNLDSKRKPKPRRASQQALRLASSQVTARVAPAKPASAAGMSASIRRLGFPPARTFR